MTYVFVGIIHIILKYVEKWAFMGGDDKKHTIYDILVLRHNIIILVLFINILIWWKLDFMGFMTKSTLYVTDESHDIFYMSYDRKHT